MPAVRIIPVVLYSGEQAIKTVNFANPRNVGSVINMARLYNARNVDELVFLDISASKESREPNYKIIEEFAKELSIPFAVGGGIRSVAQMKRILELGADKVVVGCGYGEDFQVDLCNKLSQEFGNQAVIGALDYTKDGKVYSYIYKRASFTDCVNKANVLSNFCGELILTCIDAEGTMQGVETCVLRKITSLVCNPVVYNGGVGYPGDASDAMACSANAVAMSSIFHFTKYTPKDVKTTLRENGYEVRL